MILLRRYLALSVAALLGTYASALQFSNPLDLFRTTSSTQNEKEEIQMIYYDRSSSGSVSYNYMLEKSEELMKHTDLTKPYVLYIHGYEEHPSNESVQTIVSSYLQRGTDNIIILDWSALAFGNYVAVTLRIKDVAKFTAEALSKLVAKGLDVDTLHVIGHSMGAQIGGFIGRYLDFTIPRVSGLDPANPLFYQLGAEHIDEKSGRLVDIVHTDGGIYGAYGRTGSVDFFANGGSRPQPGCNLLGVPLTPRSLCSHWRSWRFYAESVVNETAFPAIECDSYSAFLRGDCKGNRIVYFGYAMPANATGSYYFTTNAESPFGKSLAGVNPMSN